LGRKTTFFSVLKIRTYWLTGLGTQLGFAPVLDSLDVCSRMGSSDRRLRLDALRSSNRPSLSMRMTMSLSFCTAPVALQSLHPRHSPASQLIPFNYFPLFSCSHFVHMLFAFCFCYLATSFYFGFVACLYFPHNYSCICFTHIPPAYCTRGLHSIPQAHRRKCEG